MTVSIFYGGVTIDTTNQALICDGSSGTLTAGDYYVYDPGTASRSLITAIATAFTAKHAATVTATISATGYLTLSAATSFSWTLELGVATWLGYASNSYSGSNSYTAASPLKYCWFPQAIPAMYLAPPTVQGKRKTFSAQTESEDSSVFTTVLGSCVKQALTFKAIPLTLTWGTGNDTLESFYVNTLSQGAPILYRPDSTTTTVWEYVADLTGNDGFEFNPGMTDGRSAALWNWTIPLIGV